MGPGQSVCDDCHQPILRLFTLTGRLVDLDVEPHPDGTRIITTVDGDIRARTLTGHDLPAPDGTGHKLHYCPAREPAGPSCGNPACSIPMPRDIAIRERWTFHPCCEPEYLELIEQARRKRIRAQFRRHKKR